MTVLNESEAREVLAYLKQRKAELEKEHDTSGIEYVVITDALEHDGYEAGYLYDAITHGCKSGTCSGLIYYVDTHKFYADHADECDNILADYESNTGEGFRFDGNDIRNTLAWMGYEETARKVLDASGIEHRI